MSTLRYSDAYVEHLSAGPFPGRIDPWAEDRRYFQQIHSGMIDDLLTQMRRALMHMGYVAGKEVSLQIMEGRQPDVFVQRSGQPEKVRDWDYATVAAELLAEPGQVAISEQLQAIHIKLLETGELVTIVEIVSSRNKVQEDEIARYQDRRGRLLYNQGINVVEIDPTRSVKRLLAHRLTTSYPYHAVVYIPGRWPRVITGKYGSPLKRLALPLNGEAVAVELQTAYDFAYQQASIAAQIDHEKGYRKAKLPFPSLLTEQQRSDALEAARMWLEKLEQLRTQP